MKTAILIMLQGMRDKGVPSAFLPARMGKCTPVAQQVCGMLEREVSAAGFFGGSYSRSVSASGCTGDVS